MAKKLPIDAARSLVKRVGLNDAAELMELAPTRTLLRALDEALWKSPRAGAAEIFDAAELVDWLEAWNDIGEQFVADRLAAMSDEYRALCLSHIACVGIHHTLAFLDIPDDEVDREIETLRPVGSCAFYGPYLVTPAIEDEWDVVRTSLDALWTEHPECLLRTLRMLDGAESMLAAQDARRRLTIDVAQERERYRESLGYVSATGASAFLIFAATASIEELLALSAYDEETRRHLAAFGTTQLEEEQEEQEAPDDEPSVPIPEQEQLLIPQGTLLLTNQQSGKHSALTQALTELAETDQPALERSARELAYLANVIKAGTRAEGAPPSDAEARDCAYSTCERGLELIRQRGLEVRIEQEPGLIRLFALGWRTRRGISPPRSGRERSVR
jgi:hypothetical protein